MTSNLDRTLLPLELNFHAGPLHYQLRAHDAWGRCRLAELASHIAQPASTRAQIDRTIHLHHLKPDGSTHALPRVLQGYLPDERPTLTWTRHDNLLNRIWQTGESKQSFWTGGADPGLGDFRYHLPWDLIIKDMVRHGGGLIHGGMVIHQGEAVLFLAPPGGGKTTTLGSTTGEWRVLGDDSALVWPSANGIWQASPMPTWSCLIKQTEPINAGKLAIADHYPLKAVIYLNKTTAIELSKLAAVEAAPLIYRSLNEYTAAVLADPLYRKDFFKTACDMARNLPCWRLGLPLGANIWPLLANELKAQ